MPTPITADSATCWLDHELRYLDFGDVRLVKRFARLLADLVAQPTASIPHACGTWAKTKAAYRFWSSPHVTAHAIRSAHVRTTLERITAHRTILAIQDTTSLDFTRHPATRDLGPLTPSTHQGLFVHSVRAATTGGVPLGLLDQAVWARDPATTGKKHQRRKRLTSDKESQRWLTALSATQTLVPAEVQVVTIADREADIFDLFALPRPPHAHFLIRATHNRVVDHEAHLLWTTLRHQTVGGTLVVALRRGDERPARQAHLALRWTTVNLQPPRHRPARAQLQPVAVQALLAEEVNAPDGTVPIRWLLLTTLPLSQYAEAVQYVRWYTLRWLVERYHYVLKSGCRIEQLQLETADRLERALATYSIVAWRLLWLTYHAREHPDAPCTVALSQTEWQALYATHHRTTTLPAVPPGLSEAVRWIAQRGGFLGRRRDGAPGVQTIWRGLQRLHDIAATWSLLHPDAPPPDN